MRRLFFLVPSLTSAKAIVDELLLARVDEHHIHIVANDDQHLFEEHLPEANLFQTTDFVPAVSYGLSYGGATGILAGIAALTFPPAGLIFGGGAVLGLGLAGAGLGAWVSGMIGVSIPNRLLKSYEEAIDRGELMILIDVPLARVEEIKELITKHHPEATIEATEHKLVSFL
jgi:hypothetical protein